MAGELPIALTLFIVHGFLILVSFLACGAVSYRTPVTIFWACQIAVIAAQFMIPAAMFVTPIPWMLIYLMCAFSYMIIYEIDKDVYISRLSNSMLIMAIYCLTHYILQSTQPRNGDLSFALTLGLNIFTVWQGVLLYSGSKIIIKNNGG